MPFTSGTVTQFANGGGADGVLQKLLDFFVGDKYFQNIGTGNGASQTHNFTLSNTPVAKGQARLEWVWEGTKYRVWDNGEGEFDHDLVTSSSLAYDTGIGSVTLAADSGETVDITYCVGQNSGEEGRDWLVVLDQTTRTNDPATEAYSGEELKEVVLKNSGTTYKEAIYIGFRECKYPAGSLWAWNLNVYREFDEDEADWNINHAMSGQDSYDSTRKLYTTHPKIALNNGAMAYWFSGTKNKIMGAVRPTTGIYETFYAGAGLRFSSPSKYPNPLVVIGSSSGIGGYTDTSGAHKYIINPLSTGYGFWVVAPEDDYKFTTHLNFIPMTDFADSGDVAKTTHTKLLRYPVYVFDTDDDYLLFQLEGVYALACQGIASEDTLDIGAVDHWIFQDVFRTDYYNYLALEQEA